MTDDLPFGFDVRLPGGTPARYDNHIQRRLSALRGQYSDQQAYDAMLALEDTLLYEVYEIRRPPHGGDLSHGVSIVHPGTVGDEYFMTKGHYHAVLDTAEVYYCLGGIGMMVMETPEGDCAAEEMSPGRVAFVPPRWAHRSVNVGRSEDLVMLYVYPADAGHDYGTIESRGFRKLVVERDGKPALIDNPRWTLPDARNSQPAGGGQG